MSMCCGWAVSDSCSQGGVKDLSGENLQKLIETGQLYETLIFLHYCCIMEFFGGSEMWVIYIILVNMHECCSN